MERERIAVIGAGVSGLTAAYLLQRRYDVLLFEAQSRLGGHAHTHVLPAATGGTVAVDSGFIVHNERTYPNLLRLFADLGVTTQATEMSMSVRCLDCGLEYAGGKGLPGLAPSWDAVRRGRYLLMLAQVKRFYRNAKALLADDSGVDPTLGEFLRAGRYPRYFVDHLVLPLVSAVWSAGERVSRRYPARYLFEFLSHHGMLAVTGSPPWRTVIGGSRVYVERAAKQLTAVHVGTPVRAITRTARGVQVRDEADAAHSVNKVVIATHADEALALLGDPTDEERATLGAFPYSQNETWLHQDTGILPHNERARSSWNYLKSRCHGESDQVAVSYDMNRLMRLADPQPFVVTLNATDRVDPAEVIAKMSYAHPVYTPESLAAQRQLPDLNTSHTAFAGAYHGWGFHEDGCASGVRAAEHFGVGW
jgi:uncharacterized protein